MIDWKAPCQHGRYDEHERNSAKWGLPVYEMCPGGSVLPPDSLVIVKEEGEWPGWAGTAIRRYLRHELIDRGWVDRTSRPILDALAAAQPEES